MSSPKSPPYVVLVGDVGTGKSTIAEKLTGVSDRSSDSKTSVTKVTEMIWVPDGSLLIADTPGSNAIEDGFQHNVGIAAALNYQPVSKIFIVVKAETRIDSVISNIRKYTDNFLEFPVDVVAVLITHMDMPEVKWEKNAFTPNLKKYLGIDTFVFSSADTDSKTLLGDIVNACTEKHNLTVDSGNLFKLFKMHDNQRKILASTREAVETFRKKKKDFDEGRTKYTGKDEVDLVFEFQAFMTDEITEAQKRMSDVNNFTFDGDGAANEAGHVANMVNQLSAVLFNIRTECIGYQHQHCVSALRKCPYCNMIWAKVEGCDGSTECGSLPSSGIDVRNSSYDVLATFTFRWADSKLTITKSGSRQVRSERSAEVKGVGCGRSITWSKMKPFNIPPEFEETSNARTSDVDSLPKFANNFKNIVDDKLKDVQNKIKVTGKPTPD